MSSSNCIEQLSNLPDISPESSKYYQWLARRDVDQHVLQQIELGVVYLLDLPVLRLCEPISDFLQPTELYSCILGVMAPSLTSPIIFCLPTDISPWPFPLVGICELCELVEAVDQTILLLPP